MTFSLISTVFLLVLTEINHSRDTKRYRILKLSLWVLLANHEQLLYKICFLCESAAAVLILLLNLTGFFYSVEGKRFVSGVGDEVFFAIRLIVLVSFLVLVLLCRRYLTLKLFQNWTVMLVLSVAIQCIPFFVKDLQVFGFFADLFLATAFFMFHCGTYEEGTARMGTDMYRSELDYCMARKISIFMSCRSEIMTGW